MASVSPDNLVTMDFLQNGTLTCSHSEPDRFTDGFPPQWLTDVLFIDVGGITVYNIVLKPIAYTDYVVTSVYALVINTILHMVILMVIDN